MSKKKKYQVKAVIRLDKQFNDLVLIIFEKDGTLTSFALDEGHGSISLDYYVKDTLPVDFYTQSVKEFLEYLYYTVDYKDLFFIEEDASIYELLREVPL